MNAPHEKFTPEEHQHFVDGKRRRRMDAIDALPADVRALVHDYGYTVVKTFLDLGITKSNHIRHAVETVLNEFSPTRGSFSSQGIRAPLVNHTIESGKVQR